MLRDTWRRAALCLDLKLVRRVPGLQGTAIPFFVGVVKDCMSTMLESVKIEVLKY
jgi:hypothetical protein